MAPAFAAVDFYAVLRLSHEATALEISTAYRSCKATCTVQRRYGSVFSLFSSELCVREYTCVPAPTTYGIGLLSSVKGKRSFEDA
eukprot:6205037-Pleurochrysis_carterae.AAC.3